MSEWLLLWAVLYLLSISLYGILAGYGEGMTMIQYQDKMFNENLTYAIYGGIRGHKLFFLYHYFRFTEQLCFVAAILSAVFLFENFTIIIIIGGIIFMWEVFEVAYNMARYAKPLMTQENLLGVHLINHWLDVGCIHLTRILAAFILVFMGITVIARCVN